MLKRQQTTKPILISCTVFVLLSTTLFSCKKSPSNDDKNIIHDTVFMYDDLSTALIKPLSVYRLQLCDYSMKYLPMSIISLKNLKEIWFCRNIPLNLDSAFTILSLLPKLRIIDLSNDNLSNLPANIGRVQSLEKLYARDNRLYTLPIELANNTNIIVLDLSFNYIKYLPNSFKNLKKLTALSMAYNKRMNIEHLLEMINNWPSFEFLDIRGVEINRELRLANKIYNLKTIAVDTQNEPIIRAHMNMFPNLEEVLVY